MKTPKFLNRYFNLLVQYFLEHYTPEEYSKLYEEYKHQKDMKGDSNNG